MPDNSSEAVRRWRSGESLRWPTALRRARPSMSILTLVSELACEERGLTINVAATSCSITDISAGDGVWSCVELLDVCAGGGTAELHDPILARSQAVEDPARIDNDSAGDCSDYRCSEFDSSGKEAALAPTPPASTGGIC